MLDFLLGLGGGKIGGGSVYCPLTLHPCLGLELVKEQGERSGAEGRREAWPAGPLHRFTLTRSLPSLSLSLSSQSLPLSLLLPFMISGFVSLGLFLSLLSPLSFLFFPGSHLPSLLLKSIPLPGLPPFTANVDTHAVFYTVFLRHPFCV